LAVAAPDDNAAGRGLDTDSELITPIEEDTGSAVVIRWITLLTAITEELDFGSFRDPDRGRDILLNPAFAVEVDAATPPEGPITARNAFLNVTLPEETEDNDGGILARTTKTLAEEVDTASGLSRCLALTRALEVEEAEGDGL
jgi:hypothetical protein